MKLFLFWTCTLFFVATGFCQEEGQNFCEGNKDGSYFPLSIYKKKVNWQKTYYVETREGEKTVNGKNYIVFKQQWKDGSNYNLLLREENGKVYQYSEECNAEIIRYDAALELLQPWKTCDEKVQYKILDTKGTLKTPFCEYDNLMVMEAKFPTVTFLFYYLKGYGYVGATVDGEMISFVYPTRF